MDKKVSLIMANYNKAAYIGAAIESVIGQTATDWELVIIDDASTDSSVAVIRHYLHDERIRLVQNKTNRGYTRNLIDLIAMAKTGIIGIIDSDDALAPMAVRSVLDAYTADPELGVVYTQCHYCDPGLRPVHPGYSQPIPVGSSNLHLNAIHAFRTFTKDAYAKTSGYDPAIEYAEDIDLMLKLEEAAKVKFIDEPLYFYRILPGSQTHSFRNEMVNRSSTALAKLNAYYRRQGAGFPNLDRDGISEVLFFGIITSMLSGRGKLLCKLTVELFKINPLFFLKPIFYKLAAAKIVKFFKLKNKH